MDRNGLLETKDFPGFPHTAHTCEQISDAAFNFMYDTRTERECHQVTSDGAKRSKCTCLAILKRYIRDLHTQEGLTKEEIRLRLKPGFDILAKLARSISLEPESTTTLAEFLDNCVLIHKTQTQNQTHQMVFITPVGNFFLCINGFSELAGIFYKGRMKKFFRFFITYKDRDQDPKHYIHNICYPNLIHLHIYRAIAEYAGSKQLVLRIFQAADDATNARQLDNGMTARQCHAQLHMLGVDMTQNVGDNNYESLRQKYYFPIKQMVLELEDRYIILDDRVPNVVGAEADIVVAGRKIGSRSMLMAQTLAVTWDDMTFMHHGNVGTFSFPHDNPFTLELIERLRTAAGFDGCHNNFMLQVNDNQNLRYVSPINYNVASGAAVLLDHLGPRVDLSDPDDPVLSKHSDDIMLWESSLKTMCHALSPGADDIGKYDLVYTMGMMVSSRPFPQQADPILSQVPHLDAQVAEIKRMLELGIRPYIGFLPLTKEGTHIRVWPSINKDDERTFGGKLAFIPPGKVALLPMDLFHAGGFRTGPTGNLRVHTYAFLVPKELTKEQKLQVLPPVQVNEYLGLADRDTSTLHISPLETNPRKVRWLNEDLTKLLNMIGF